ETLKVGELAIVDFPTGLGWGFTILKKTASGDYIDITKVVTELMAEQAAFGGHAGVKLPNEVLGEMRKAGFFGVDFDVAINEVMAEVAKMPRYANYFKPPKTVSPSANGIVTPAQCSCVVNIPVQGNEVIIYSSPRPGLDQLVKFEKVTNMGKISTRATVNTAAGENITQIAIGSVEGGAIVQMPALNGKVTAGTNPGLQITDVDFEAINQVRITVSDQLNSAAEATLVQQGGEKILFIKARKLDNIVLSGKDAVPVTTVTIPVPTVNTIPQLDPKLVEGWLSADAGAFGKVVRQKVLDNVRRVSFNDFSTELTANTKRLNTVLAETDEPFAVLLEFRPSKSRRWVFDLAKDSFTKKPSVVTYMPHPMESFSKVAQRATDKKINTFVIMDDATYTGLATDASNSITMRSIKKVSDWYKTMMPTVKPKFIVSMPYATKESTAFFEAFPDASVRVVNNTKMKTLGEILTSDELKYIEALDPSSAGRVVTTFDHKLPDAASHAKPVSELYFEGAKSPYKIPGTEYFESEQLDFYNWYRYGRFVDETQSTALPAPNVKDVLPPNFESSWAQPQQEAFLRNLIQDIRTNSANYPREFVTRATQQYDEIVAGWLEN
ncbi:MAG: hypothetical protein QGI60_04670, partial [archaeon]|nr:hypothetical protein [archaeon]